MASFRVGSGVGRESGQALVLIEVTGEDGEPRTYTMLPDEALRLGRVIIAIAEASAREAKS